MAMAETARLIASLELDPRKFNAGADKALSKLNKLSTKSVAIGSALGVGLERLAEAGVRKLAGAVTGGLDSLASLEDATTSVTGAIAQVAPTWHTTAADIAASANQIEANIQAAFDDKDITQGASALIRYGKVTEGNLKPAMQVMADLAARTGDVGSASDLLAKALLDPTSASRALKAAGVVLTKGQLDQVKALRASGKEGQAQKLILDAMAKSTKGAAAAVKGPFRDSQNILRDVVEDAERALATGLLPVIMEVRDELSKELAKKSTLENIKRLGEGLAGGFRDAVTFVKQIPWDQVGSVLKGAADFGSNLAHAFTSLPTEAKGLILGLAALNKLSGGAVINVGVDLLKGAGGALFQQFLGKGSPANPMFVVPVGGGLGGSPAGAAAGAASSGLGVISKVFLVGEAIGLAALVGQVAADVGAGAKTQTDAINKTLQESLAGKPSVDELKIKLAAIETGIDRLPTDPIGKAIFQDSINELQTMRADVVDAIARSALVPSPQELQSLREQKAAITTLRQRTEAVNRETRIGVVGAQRTGADRIVSAIERNRPNVTVNVSQSLTRVTYATGKTLNRYAGKIVPIW